MRRSFVRHSGLVALAVGALAAACALQGCNIIGGVAYVIQGPPKVERQHELDSDRPTVVFIDDRTNVMPRRSLRASMGLEADQTLLEKKVIRKDKMLAAQAALGLASGDKLSAPKSVAAIGRAVGAEVVIYVDMKGFTLSSDGASYSPAATALVKVVDALNNQRLWPPDGDGWPLTVQPPVQGDGPTTIAEKNKAETALAQAAGREVARLFFTYEREGASRARTAPAPM